MQRADHLVTADDPIGQRPTAMWAAIVEGKDTPVAAAEHGDLVGTDPVGTPLSERYVVEGAHAYLHASFRHSAHTVTSSGITTELPRSSRSAAAESTGGA